jgi:hypothetical protein
VVVEAATDHEIYLSDPTALATFLGNLGVVARFCARLAALSAFIRHHDSKIAESGRPAPALVGWGGPRGLGGRPGAGRPA